MPFPDLLFNTELLPNTAETGGLKTVSSGTDEPQKNIFALMTKAQALKLGVGDKFQLADTDGNGTISEDEFINYKTSSKPLIDKSVIDKLSAMSPKEKVEYIKQQLPQYIDMSKADGNLSGMNITQALQTIGITEELLKENGLTIEEIKDNPELFGNFLYKQLDERYQNDINNKDGETWQNEYQRLKNGEYTDFEKDVLGLSGDLTDEQLEAYTKQAIEQKYKATMAAIITSSDINTDDEGEMAYVAGVMQGMRNSFLENDEKAYLIAAGLTRMSESENVYTESTASKIAENADAYGVFDGNAESAVLAAAAIIQTASPESIENFILSNPEHADLIKQVAENVISSMPDGSRKEVLQKTLNSAMAKVEAETKISSSKDTKTTVSASTDNNSQNIKSQIPPPPDNITSAPVTDPINEQTTPTTVSVSSLQVKKSVPESCINTLNGVVDDIEEFKNGSLETGLKNLVDIYNAAGSNVAVKSKIKNFFASLKPAYRAEMYVIGGDSMRAFMSGQNLVTVSELSDYFKQKPDELEKFKDIDLYAYELTTEYMSKHAAGKSSNYDNFNPLMNKNSLE